MYPTLMTVQCRNLMCRFLVTTGGLSLTNSFAKMTKCSDQPEFHEHTLQRGPAESVYVGGVASELFRQLDTDGNGVVDRGELSAGASAQRAGVTDLRSQLR